MTQTVRARAYDFAKLRYFKNIYKKLTIKTFEKKALQYNRKRTAVQLNMHCGATISTLQCKFLSTAVSFSR